MKMQRLVLMILCLGFVLPAYALYPTLEVDYKLDPNPVYLRIKPAFVTNIASTTKTPVMAQIQIELLCENELAAQKVRYHEAQLKDTTLMRLSGYDYMVLLSPKGREKLRKHLHEDIKYIMLREEGKPLVEEVLFTKFILKR